MSRPAARVALLALALASVTVVFGAARVLAAIGADRCCADHCERSRNAAMDVGCCGLSVASDTGASSTTPAAAAAALPAALPSRLVVLPERGGDGRGAIERPPDDGGPPRFLRERSLLL